MIPKSASESALASIRAHLEIAAEEVDHVEDIPERELLRAYLKRGPDEVKWAERAIKKRRAS